MKKQEGEKKTTETKDDPLEEKKDDDKKDDADQSKTDGDAPVVGAQKREVIND